MLSLGQRKQKLVKKTYLRASSTIKKAIMIYELFHVFQSYHSLVCHTLPLHVQSKLTPVGLISVISLEAIINFAGCFN